MIKGWTADTFKFRSIQVSLSVAFLCLILFSILVTSLISYRLSAQSVERNSEHYISEIVQQVNLNLQSYINNMENIGILALTNKDLKYYIESTSFLLEEDVRPYEKKYPIYSNPSGLRARISHRLWCSATTAASSPTAASRA